ncbi:MAG: hypothetical protein ACO1RX_13750 [Candidatus Sericytochromatia bacterium]
MERYRFIYLSGLIPVMAASILLFLWILTGTAPVRWMGLLLTPLGFVLAMLGVYHASLYYMDRSVSDGERQRRRKHFLGHTVVLSLGLTLSFQGFNIFRSASARTGSDGLMVTISNTSDQAVKNLQIQVGGSRENIPEIAPRAKKDLRFNVLGETTLKAQLGDGESARKAEVLVGSDNHTVLVRIDYQQNILPEVQ